MNIKIVLRMLGNLVLIEALLLTPSLCIALYDGNGAVWRAILLTIGLLVLVGLTVRRFCRPADRAYYVREGFVLVSLSWILLSAFGALPFFLSGEIPSYLDALFEMVSGFTTTGASVLADVESLSRALLYWRSFSHWLGGMGILVFMLALLPSTRGSGEAFHLLRAESPGPAVEKLVPRMHQHAMILYGIYLGMTLLCFGLLMAGGMPVFDGICITFGAVGTGGFAIHPGTLASYGSFCEIVVTVFMSLCGVNFNLYFLLLMRRPLDALRDEELRVYFGMMAAATAVITANIAPLFGGAGEALRHAAFTVSSMMTSTGYAYVDYDLWPELSRAILLILMIFGASAGSTGGGFKIARLVLLMKSIRWELRRLLHPNAVFAVRMNGRSVKESTLQGLGLFLRCYLAILLISFLLISIDGFSLETNLSAVISCLNNIGPGLGMVGPSGSYAGYSTLSKMVLAFDMLLGRLEIFPLLILFNFRFWNRAH